MATQEKRESKIKQIKALIEKANSTDSLQEAESAMLLAQKLLQQYNIEMQEVESHTSEAEDGSGKITEVTVRYSDEWEYRLIQAISDNNFCFIIVDRDLKESYIIGRDSNVQVVIYLNTFFRIRLQELSLKAYDKDIKDKKEFFVSQGIDFAKLTKKNKYEENFLSDFLIGGVHGIRSKFYKQLEEAKKDDNFRALVKYNDKAIEEYAKKHRPFTKKKGSKKQAPSSNGYAQGLEAGKNLTPHHAIESNGKSPQRKITKLLN